MARNSALRRRLWRLGRVGVTLGSWVAAASLAQSLFGPQIARRAERLEQRIEQQIERRSSPPPDPQPQRSHEEESFEPWELVSV
jgi:hypothetical protein